MDKIQFTKDAVKLVVGTSVYFTAANVLRNNIAPATPAQKAAVYIGSVALGRMAAKQADQYTDKTIDDIVSWYQKIKLETTP